MRRLKILDLFCCQGGAGMGYWQAGFDVYSIDLDPQPRNPFPFYQGDAVGALRILLKGGRGYLGRGIPKAHPMSPGTPRRAVRVDDALWFAALTLAKARGDKLSDIIRAALVAYVREWGTE